MVEECLINGSGLFFFKSTLDIRMKEKIYNWYNSLSEEDRKFVDILREETKDESEFFANDPYNEDDRD
jgi:hypothetical protein